MAVMLTIGLWGLDRGGMWGDESVTFQVAQRTVPQIWRLLHDVDAVHGLYYLFMHAVLTVHPSEVVLRLPSVCAATATAGLVAALGVRLAGPRVGLWAGVLYAITPMTGHYAQEGRSYALVAAGVAGATLLLVRAVDTRGARAWWPYGTVVALTCVLHELAVPVLGAHAGNPGFFGCFGQIGNELSPFALLPRGQLFSYRFDGTGFGRTGFRRTGTSCGKCNGEHNGNGYQDRGRGGDGKDPRLAGATE